MRIILEIICSIRHADSSDWRDLERGPKSFKGHKFRQRRPS